MDHDIKQMTFGRYGWFWSSLRRRNEAGLGKTPLSVISPTLDVSGSQSHVSPSPSPLLQKAAFVRLGRPIRGD
ncbi:hypothetical protein CFAM422_000980 [Trichoderma lentiforme]|uniref:Uncharacterized protein n=1 Tax=Trichoderma lentiforme TaxID=1567552 RepID=A0A9P4XNY0_9HYPO|nr:hypothetical protein CFAM422_000980 [Trichoderma lentiforme]